MWGTGGATHAAILSVRLRVHAPRRAANLPHRTRPYPRLAHAVTSPFLRPTDVSARARLYAAAPVAAVRMLIDAHVAVVVDSVADLRCTGERTESGPHISAVVVAITHGQINIVRPTGWDAIRVGVTARLISPIAVLVDAISAEFDLRNTATPCVTLARIGHRTHAATVVSKGRIHGR